jgi:hypothetical protein
MSRVKNAVVALLLLLVTATECFVQQRRPASTSVVFPLRLVRRTTAAAAAAAPEPELEEGTRVKLKEEIASPFRKVRLFFYSAMGIAGGLGAFTTVPALLLAVRDGGGGGGGDGGSSDALSAALNNIAIDVGGIVGAVTLWNRDTADERQKLERFAEKEKKLSFQLTDAEKTEREQELARMPVQVQISEQDENVTRIVPLGDLQAKGKQHVIVVAGSRPFVRDAVISAKIEGVELFNAKETFVVPVVLDDVVQLEEGRDAVAKGFGAPKETLMSAPYIGKPTQINVWQAYLQKEIDLAVKQGEVNIVDKGLVLAVKRTGKVVRRGVGIPPWKVLVDEMQDKVGVSAEKKS